MIVNFEELATDGRRRHALLILEEGLRAALPATSLRRVIREGKILLGGTGIDVAAYGSVYVVAFGKAALSMTAAVCGSLRVSGGIAVVPPGLEADVGPVRVLRASHPVPDQSSVDAAAAVTKFLEMRRSSDLVLFLVSGGASSLLCLPDGISLEEKARVSRMLLASGASIDEFNCVRKHVSKIKGGLLVSRLRCDAVSLVMSDVPGNDLSSIASGTTYCDSTTFGDALSIIRRYGLEGTAPPAVLRRLELGAAGGIPETPKRPRIPHLVVSSNSDCLEAMEKKAQQLGYGTVTLCTSGDVEETAREISEAAPSGRRCVLFGGETTVRVHGGGRGGRNQELVLRILDRIRCRSNRMVVASIGTDGIDGNTACAGAITGNSAPDAAEIRSSLERSDSHSFFERHGGLVRTGPTGTNLADIGLLLA